MPEVAEPPAAPPPPAAHPGAVTIDLGNLGKKPKPVESVVVTPTPPPAEEPPKVETPPPAEPAKVETPPAAVEPKKADTKEENMANLRKAREAAEAEAARLKAELETLRTKPPELPEDVKTRLSKTEQLEKEREDLQRTIRQLDLSKDPEFQAKYNKPILESITLMGQAALAAGITEAEWKRANEGWDRKQFAEWTETMEPLQRIEFSNAWRDAEKLWRAQQAELNDAEKTSQELQKRRQEEAEAQQKQYFTQNEQLARSVLASKIKPETLAEYEDLGPAAETVLLRAARHEIPAQEIFEQLAANQVLARVTVKQNGRIAELEAQLAEREQKIKDQETFIANHAGAVPRGDAAGATTPAGKSGPIWNNLVVKTP